MSRVEHSGSLPRTIHFSTMLGARPYGWEYPDGDSYATLQLPGALHVNSAQTYEAAALAGLGSNPGPLLGDWPILREWSACGGSYPNLRRRAPRRVPSRSTSAFPFAQGPRIHEMDRKCARALPRIGERSRFVFRLTGPEFSKADFGAKRSFDVSQAPTVQSLGSKLNLLFLIVGLDVRRRAG